MDVKRCKLCKHIYDASEGHVCPTTEYITARDALVRDAAIASELIPEYDEPRTVRGL